MEKRAGLHLLGEDVYINVAGGMTIDEPAADLGVVAAVASSVKNRAVGSSTAVFGEVGLGGEVRAITQPALRLREAARMGFERCIVPQASADLPKSDRPPNCELIGVRTVDEALQALLQ
jgi:DNA repair protein RadA/Sms